MVFLTFNSFGIPLVPLVINPYLVLGIKKGSSINETNNKFREKLAQSKNDNKSKAKICLAYDIIINNSYYDEIEKDNFELIKLKIIYIIVVIILLLLEIVQD